MYRRVCRVLSVCAQGAILSMGHVMPVFAQASSQSSTPGLQVPMAREASGTSWLPDNTPMYAIHWQRGPWQIMFHENAFLQSLNEASDRVDNQVGSINWVMGMAQRNVRKGRLM